MNIHENCWRNNFQYEIKTVTFAFAFANDEILKKREQWGDDTEEKKIVMNFNITPRNGNRGVIYESTIDLRFNKSLRLSCCDAKIEFEIKMG